MITKTIQIFFNSLLFKYTRIESDTKYFQKPSLILQRNETFCTEVKWGDNRGDEEHILKSAKLIF